MINKTESVSPSLLRIFGLDYAHVQLAEAEEAASCRVTWWRKIARQPKSFPVRRCLRSLADVQGVRKRTGRCTGCKREDCSVLELISRKRLTFGVIYAILVTKLDSKSKIGNLAPTWSVGRGCWKKLCNEERRRQDLHLRVNNKGFASLKA